MSKCLLNIISPVFPNTSLTFSRTFSCSKYLFTNYYEILKVAPGASAEEIKKAYFKLSKENHPDLHPNDPTCHDRFIKLQEAYQVLGNTATRRRYDLRNGNRRPIHASKRPYADPDFSKRDEWIKKQNERMKEIKYGEYFGRRPDDPRYFNSYYDKRIREEMKIDTDLFLLRMRVVKYLCIIIVISCVGLLFGSEYLKNRRKEQTEVFMVKEGRLTKSNEDPHRVDSSF